MAMSKLDFITIFIVVICIAALGFLVSKTMGVMNADDSTPAVEEVIDNTITDEADEYDFDDEGNIKNTDDASTSTADNNDDGDDDYPVDGDSSSNEDDTETLEFDDEEDKSSNDDSANQSSHNSLGAYLVLAGSYKEKVNAEIQVRKLHRMGYDNAEVRSFNRGAYAVALVDRFDNYSAAAALKRKLADKGIDVFVKKKR